MTAAAAAAGCSLADTSQYCDTDGDCPSGACGVDFICLAAPPADAGAPMRVREEDEDDPEEAPSRDAGPSIEPAPDEDGRPPEATPGWDAGALPVLPAMDAGSDENGRVFGAEPGDTPPPDPGAPVDAGSDENGRCLVDWACADGEQCVEGVCTPSSS